MKELHCSKDRETKGSITYKSGPFSYEFIADYPKDMPGYLTYAGIAGGACDAEGNLYLGYRGTPNPIVKLDPEGRYEKEFGAGLIVNCHFLTVTKENTILISDLARHCFREIDTDGNLIRDFGTPGVPGDSGFNPNLYREQRRAGHLWPPEMVAGIPNMLTMPIAYSTIQKLGTPFTMPTDAAQDSKGDIFLSDGYGNVAVHHFSRDGKHIKTWGGKGDEPGKFLMVHAIAIDKKDQLWVCDRDQNALHVFDTEGNVLAYCKDGLGMPSGIVADDEYIYVVGRNGYMTIFTPDFEIAAEIGYFNCELRTHGLAINGKGDLFLFPSAATEDHQCIKLRRI